VKVEPDVVVVGGGAAGCVVAGRLSESRGCSVLLLEAGPDLRADLPEVLRDGWHITREYDWGYTTEGEELGAVQKLRRGKALGGTAWYTRYALRGTPAGYDDWERVGNKSWNFENALPYLKHLETDLDFGDAPWHGDGGPIPITRYPHLESSEAGEAVMRAYEASGFALVEDLNRPDALGAGRMPMNSHDGLRVITAQAYLPRDARPNLEVRADEQVAQVLFDGDRATGVTLLDGTQIHAGCVVLSAGVYGSPCILLRSGVGPSRHLQSLRVPVRVALPGVGENLGADVAVDVDCGYRGPVRNEPLFRYVAMFRSSEARGDAPPDLMFWPQDPYGDPPVFTIDVLLTRPRSRGRVQLRSTNPADPPRIELGSLTDPSDLHRLTEGYERGSEVAGQPILRRLCPGPLTRLDVAQNAYPLPHAFGTCVMGPSPDDGAVVDSSGRVYGTQRLFVVDASIMPSVPSGFTHIPTIMLAERITETIAASLA